MAAASYSAQVKAMVDYLNSITSQTTAANQAAASQASRDPSSQIQGTATAATQSATVTPLRSTPAAAMGADTLNQFTTTIAQGLTSSLVSLPGIGTTVDSFFTAPLNMMTHAYATFATLPVEIAMAMARNTARNIVTELNNKDALTSQLQAELIALHNAVLIVLNSEPFFNNYITQLTSALQQLVLADANFKSVVSRLQTKNLFSARLFQQGIAELDNAKNLILPNRNANVTTIRGVTTLATSIGATLAADAQASVLAMPGICYNIGTILIKLALSTLNVNNYLGLYYGAYQSLLNIVSSPPPILYTVMANYIQAGTNQLDTLLAGMKATLSNNPGASLYPATVTSQATIWGLTVATIEQYMKAAPTAGLGVLDQTGTSLARYNASVKLLQAIGNQKYVGGVLDVTQAQELWTDVSLQITSLMLLANTVVVRPSDPKTVLTLFQHAISAVQAQQLVSARIRAALTPFILTPFSSSLGAAQTLVGQWSALCNTYSLDRWAGLIQQGDTAGFFNSDPAEATSAGSALVGMNQIITAVAAQPEANDQQIAALSDLRDQIQRDLTNQQLEASRSSSSTLQQQIQDNLDALAAVQQQIDTATAAAEQLDANANAANITQKTTEDVNNASPGFGTQTSTFENQGPEHPTVILSGG